MNRAPSPASLLFLASFLGCSSLPTSTGTDAAAYVLRIDGEDVSLTLAREMSVPEFLAVAQQVTNARYVYRRDQVAAAKPVTLVGCVQCKRAAFPAFVDAMLGMSGLRADVRGTDDERFVEISGAS